MITMAKEAYLPTLSLSHDLLSKLSALTISDASNTALQASKINATISTSYILLEGLSHSQKAIQWSAHSTALKKALELSRFYTRFTARLQKCLKLKLIYRNTLLPKLKI